MRILMIGSGGREHALIKTLKKSPKVTEIICAPGNGGISRDAECFPIPVIDKQKILELAVERKVDLVFVAPEDPLNDGLVDLLEQHGIRAFGPNSRAAQIEASKAFAKNLMKKYKIPTADFEVFNDPELALGFVKQRNKYPVVVKADGLALGKGVVICHNLAEAENAINEIMVNRIFGDSGNKVVVEEYITGPEVSVLAFCDGNTIKPMVSAMDHKPVFDGNKGPNTGGMGTISPNPFYTEEIANECMEKIFLPTVNALKAEGRPFKGCIFFGLMLTQDGPKVVEYNCRFGDPETQVVLLRLKTELVDIINAVIDGELDKINIEWDERAAACIIMASGGYPGSYKKGLEITGLDQNGQVEGATVFHAGTIYDGAFKTNGGRVLGVSALGQTLDEALERAYSAVEKICFKGAHFRRDIGRVYNSR